jgi:hypothetical protein
MTKKLLLLTFVIIEGADAWTTNILLSHGGGELNPFMALFQTSMGNLWVIPKMGLALVVASLLSRSKKPLHIAGVVAFCATAVVNNFIAIAGMQ